VRWGDDGCTWWHHANATRSCWFSARKGEYYPSDDQDKVAVGIVKDARKNKAWANEGSTQPVHGLCGS
jgi:hypothetical protein